MPSHAINAIMETDLESLKLGEKVISATRKIFKLNSKLEEIKKYVSNATSATKNATSGEPEDVEKAFENLNRSVTFLEEKLGEDQSPHFRYTGK